MYWGYKFEDLMTTTAKKASKDDEPLNENSEFNCMFV